MRLTSKLPFTSLGRLVYLLALVFSTAGAAYARPKPVPHHGRIFIPKMLPTVIPTARTGYQTVLRGRASWYGKFFQGMETASGELYDRFQYTCAHKKLPFGTRLRVTNVKNGVTVVVRVTDRGPFRKERIIDLSEQAAGPLGLIESGSSTVIAVVVPETTPLGIAATPADLLALRAGDPRPRAPFTAYLLPLLHQADALVAAVSQKAPLGPLASLAASSGQPVAGYLVQAGSFADRQQAEAQLARIHTIDPNLPGNIQVAVIAGEPTNIVYINQLSSWLAAETVRRNLQVWGIPGQVRPSQPTPDPQPNLADGDAVVSTIN